MIPILGNSTDSRLIIKVLFFFLLIVGIGTVWKQRKEETNFELGESNRKKFLYIEILFIIILLFTFNFSYIYKLFEHLNSFFLVDFDFISIAEILNNSSKGFFFRTHHYGQSIHGDYLSHHFSPSLLLLAPFIFLSKTRLGYAYGLLFYINLSFIFFAILLIKKQIRGNLFIFSICLFAFNIYVHRLFFSYHSEILVIPFFLLFFIGIEFRKLYLSILGFLILILLKEDISLYLSCLGLYFIFKQKWVLGISITIISLGYFFFIPSYFQKFLDQSAQTNWLNDWSKWGVTYKEIIINIILNPLEIIKVLFSKWKVFRDFFFSFSPIVLLSPKLLIVTFPILILQFLSDKIWYNSLYNYYSYTIISFYVICIIFSVHKLETLAIKKYSLGIIIICLSFSLYSSSGDKLFPYTKIPIDLDRLQTIKTIIEYLPENKTVSTQFDLGGFIPRNNPIYPLHEKNLDKDYILIDAEKGITPYVSRERIEKMIELILKNNIYSLVIEKNGIQLFKKN